MLKTTIVGGDARQLYLAAYLLKKGFGVSLCGIDTSRISLPELSHVKSRVLPAEECIPSCDVIILPIPVSKDGFTVSSPLYSGKPYELSSVLDLASPGTVFTGGCVSGYIRSQVTERKLKIYDYNESEVFQLRNSIPTAEGALEAAMRELPVTVRGTKTLVFGYGRCGKAIASLFDSAGADVTVCARSASALAEAECSGLGSVKLSSVLDASAGYRLIINTVPYPVINKEFFAGLAPGTLIIDIASLPGGITDDVVARDDIKTVFTGSLPGKTSPESAGIAVGRSVLEILEGTGISV